MRPTVDQDQIAKHSIARGEKARGDSVRRAPSWFFVPGGGRHERIKNRSGREEDLHPRPNGADLPLNGPASYLIFGLSRTATAGGTSGVTRDAIGVASRR